MVNESLFGGYELPNDDFSHEILHHLSRLKTELKHYFLYVTYYAYITNPFSIDPLDLPDGTGQHEELIDIQSDKTARVKQKE